MINEDKECLLGIDIGTQSIRAALLNLSGDILALKSVSQDMNTHKPGYAVQDPQFWWESTVKNIRGILGETNIKPSKIAAVGVCAHMHGPVPITSAGELLSREVQLYCDKRGEEIVKRFSKKHDVKKLLKISGNPPTPNWFGFKIKWLQENQPELYNRADKFLVPKDFINFRLTGEAVIDPSEASGSYLMNANDCQWSAELIELLELDIVKLPKIFDSAEIIGRVNKETATLTGMIEGTPVVAGGGDMLCSLLTSALTKKGRVADITGTGSIICFYSEEPHYDERLMNLRHVIPGWIPFGIIDHSGGALRWFRDEFCENEIIEAEKKNIDVHEILNKLAAEEEPGNNGLLFFPYLMGERTLGSSYSRGVFLGFNPAHNKGSAIRAIMEGVAFEHKRTLEIMEKGGYQITAVYHCGGGSKSKLWSQIKANIYQKPVYTIQTAEGGIVGAAILAGAGAGIFSDSAAGAEQITKIKEKFEPNEKLNERYQYLFERYKEAHDLLQDTFDKLALIP